VSATRILWPESTDLAADTRVERTGSGAWVTPAWMLGWWRTHRPSAGLRIVTVFEGDELVALGPFCQMGPPGLRIVRFLGQVHQPNRVLTAPGRGAAAGLVWDALCRRGSVLDLFGIEDRPETGYRLLVESPRWSVFDEPSDTCVRIVLGSSADDYFGTRPELFKDMQRVGRKVERDGHTVDVVGADTPMELEALLPEIASIAAAAQRDRFLSGDLESLARGIVPGTIAAMARAGRVRVTLVRLDERPAAFALDFLGGGTVNGHLMAFDREWQSYAPGRRCMEEVLRWAVKQGRREFDLGVGTSDYKRRWSDDEYHTRRVVAARTPTELALARAGMSFGSAMVARSGRLRRPTAGLAD
jgi:CelD/BcsL family acetyltransferase involved in cellulose biosynthesis